MKLRHAMLFVSDLPRMLAFYRDGLGLRARPDRAAPGWEELDAGGASLALHQIPPHIAATVTIASPPAAREDTPIKLIFEVDDLDAARATLVAHGAIMKEPYAWGACDGIDPEGNVFQIAKPRPE